ncbi:formate--tetrahydrofolate ligase [Lentilactobacillus sp. Marseille-Q4993]|uniref:formate--tetrahydrofolate ligase n=1 Tax=Lentilactobacillus sp. Marseille-Q4993 TaxID=3039492 RepID=UPI0024BD4866|nr:formate--tetrahydrofolate ligase [Lentilactobacillus sp. Marseille-Q4993]
MASDIEIAQSIQPENIKKIAEKAGISEDRLQMYGTNKAKVDAHSFKDAKRKGKLILVTAISPTPAGEGKTTVGIGLNDALNVIGKNSIVAIREPSMGPVFGMKGGAAGGGYSQVIPMEDINLHFTGDLHAIGAANNLLAAMIDNHIHQGNALNIDVKRVTWKRVLDMNDRQLRDIVGGLGNHGSGIPREDGFEITAASEVMAILCLSTDLMDLKQRLGNIVIGYDCSNAPIKASQLHAQGAMAAILKDAIKPNLVQTLAHNPAFVHGGPFANIAHGCSSLTGTDLALKLGDYVVTEAGFGGDLGAEKFLDIVAPKLGQTPDATVVVATVRALKMHGGLGKDELDNEDLDALKKGMPNLLRHVHNMHEVYGLSTVVAINKFPTDIDAEVELVKQQCKEQGIEAVPIDVWGKGGEGATELAEEVVKLTEQPSDFHKLYDVEEPIADKIEKVATKIYGADGISLSAKAKTEIKRLDKNGFGKLPICIAKTQYSFSTNKNLLGAPTGFKVPVVDVKVSAGAGFVLVSTGSIMTMPGLPKVPAAENIDVTEDGKITGLF